MNLDQRVAELEDQVHRLWAALNQTRSAPAVRSDRGLFRPGSGWAADAAVGTDREAELSEVARATLEALDRNDDTEDP